MKAADGTGALQVIPDYKASSPASFPGGTGNTLNKIMMMSSVVMNRGGSFSDIIPLDSFSSSTFVQLA